MQQPFVVVLQHAAAESAGLLGETLRKQGVELRTVRTFEGEAVPKELADAAGLVVMGGPMGVADTEAHPFLKGELALLEQALRSETPVFGVCLGSQLLAAALGSKISAGPQKEIGWHEIELTDQGLSDPLWKGTASRFMAFHWHGDVFSLPGGATLLGRSRLTPHQLFRYGKNAYGALCHLEVTRVAVLQMVNAFGSELQREKLDPNTIEEETTAHVRASEERGAEVFSVWADMVTSRR